MWRARRSCAHTTFKCRAEIVWSKAVETDIGTEDWRFRVECVCELQGRGEEVGTESGKRETVLRRRADVGYEFMHDTPTEVDVLEGEEWRDVVLS